MPIDTRQDGEVTILDVSGKLTIGAGDVEVRDAIHEALAAGSRKILLNMAGVTAMDSSGVGELVAARTSVINRGGSLKLVSLSPKVARILQVTQLLGLMESYQDESTALVAFSRT